MKYIFLLLLPLLAALVVTTIPATPAFADDSDNSESESEEVETEETDTEESDDTDTEDTETETTDNTDDAETEDSDTEAETEDTETETESVTAQAAPADNPGNGNTQPGRVGSHDQQTSPEGSNGGGTVTDPTITGDPNVVDPGDTITTNCFGKVISHEAQEHKTDPDEGTLGEHSSDPVPEIPGNETPRQGIGNQNQGHPAAHGAFNSQFEEEDAENVAENC